MDRSNLERSCLPCLKRSLSTKNCARPAFPLPVPSRERYGPHPRDNLAVPAPRIPLVSLPAARQSNTRHSRTVDSVNSNPARDYVFDWGKYAGQHFSCVPEDYLRTIGGQLSRFEPQHPGLREAFDYYRPGPGHVSAAKQPSTQPNQILSHRPVPNTNPFHHQNTLSLSDSYTFTHGAHKGKRLVQVDEHYLRTIRNNKHAINTWPGLKAALQDFERKTRNRNRVRYQS